ncbi:hypothetical protein VKT23_017314 [Stygiomarasmius scandens]|uniref:Uncharacterized protein n=1 Tax=Marasmiellus scandens TaxID=2682957 RepID=A0ABR1ISP7_9AGAR
MSLPSLDISSQNPVDASHLDAVLHKLGHTLEPEERSDFLTLLRAFHENISVVREMPGTLSPQ